MKRFVVTVVLYLAATTAAAASCPFSLLSAEVHNDAGFHAGDVALADFNHDTYPDAVVVNRDSGSSFTASTVTYVTYFPGLAGGGFGQSRNIETGEPTQRDVAAVDWDNDGNTDIVLLYSNYHDINNVIVYSHLKVLYGHGDGTFTVHNFGLASQNPSQIAVGDFNNDHKPDLAVLNGMGFDLYLNGSEYPVSYNTPPQGTPIGAEEAIAAGDFDGDGKLDVAYTLSNPNEVIVRFGMGNGQFENTNVILATPAYSLEVDPAAASAADFNGDGKDDIVVVNNDWRGNSPGHGTLSILISNGDRSFAPAVNIGTIRNSFECAVTDIDGDGKQDVIVASIDGCCNNAALVFRGNGDGTFQQQQAYAAADALGIAVADVDLNGSPDVVLTGFSGKLSLLKNSCSHVRLSMNSSANPVNQGTDVTVSATAVAGQGAGPTGTLALTLSNNTLSSGDVSLSGTTSATLSDLTPGTYPIIATYSGDPNFAAASAMLAQVVVVPPFGAPPRLTATNDGGPVSLSWIGTNGVDHYEIWRSNGAGFIKVGESPVAQFSDTIVSTNSAYLYKVRGVATGGFVSSFSPVDPTVTSVFTDITITPGVTTIKLAHLTQLRDAINALRNVYLMGNFGWSEPSPSLVKAAHWLELRDALNATRTANGLPAISFANPAPSANSIVRAAHVDELRNAVR